MLRIMRRYQKGVLGVLAILFISLAMAGFGIEMFMTGKERQAITVNEKSVSYSDYYQELRQTRDRYVQMFGAKFSELAKSFNLNLPQQVVDQMINGLLIEEQAGKLGLDVGNEEVRGFIEKSFDRDISRYSNYLKVMGMSAPQFEERARKDLVREQFSSILKLASFSSKQEAQALLTKEETTVDLQYALVSSDKVLADMPVPDDATLKAYFESNMTDFQSDAQASYQYLVVAPNAAADEVLITDEDVAFHLSENEERYSTPERAKIRHIELLFPKDSTEAQQKEVKDRADTLLKRAKDGESFEALVLEASDDITTKTLGGEVGWIDRKSLH
jgi:peptidyl-prolyl cis-trans isomerase D